MSSPLPQEPPTNHVSVNKALEHLTFALGCPAISNSCQCSFAKLNNVSQLFQSYLVLLTSLAISHRFTFADVSPFIQYGARSFSLTKAAAWGLYGGAFFVARVVHCATHGIDLDSRAAQFIPVHIPTSLLREVGLHMPMISLVLSYPENPFLVRKFPTRLAAIRAAEQFQDWVNYNLFWLADCILRSRITGVESGWDFGAVIGVSKREFHRRMAEFVPNPTLDQIPFRADGTFYFTGMDLG